jgi:alkanesulfonate monooxygenase SsuD/methylene tetrahydromethanopterin reductase-like flavin-dependent oxidoreductase (luciferase family)
VKVGVILPLFSGDPHKVLDAAREAERLGYDGVFAFDHFFPPGAPRDRAALEAFTTLAAVAAVTERVAIGTMVTRASLRPPGLLAKQVSWLDSASGGRFVLGIGTGDPIDRAEHEAYGIPELDKPTRREHLEETITALKNLFNGRPFLGGTHVPRLEGPLLPPARPGGPPIWVGAQADPVVRIAGRIADGWNGWGIDAAKFAQKVEVLREAAGDRKVTPTWAGIVLAGKDAAETAELAEKRSKARGVEDQAWTGTTEELVSFLGDLKGAGAEWAVMVLAGPADRRALVAEAVLPSVR